MEGFRKFFESKEEEADIRKTLSRIPQKHRNLVKGFDVRFQGTNTLNNDRKHVGVIQFHPHRIVIAAPWRYSREITFLHEVGHIAWATLPEDRKKEWSRLVKATPMDKEDRQNPEELFSMAYAATYANHPPTTYHKESWIKFIKSI